MTTKAIVLLCDIYADSTKLWEVRDCTWFYFHLMPICVGFYFALRGTTQFTSLFGFYIHRWICLFINNSKTSACPVKMLQRYTCISVGKYTCRQFWSFLFKNKKKIVTHKQYSGCYQNLYHIMENVNTGLHSLRSASGWRRQR